MAVPLTGSGRRGGAGRNDLSRAASRLDLLFGGRGERRRLDRQLLREVALAQDLHRAEAARDHTGPLQRRQVDHTGREALLNGPEVDSEDLRAEVVLEPLLGEA